jgi:hypothetical protein
MNPCEEMRRWFLENYTTKSSEKESEEYLKFLLESNVSRMVFMGKYNSLPPIEEMEEKEKKEMKLYVHELLPLKSVEEKLIACKMLYTIGTLL